MKICKICGRKLPDVAFHSKRADCIRCRSRAERKTPAVAEEDNFLQEVPKARTYVVTYAQNATPVHKKFFRALKVYCEHNNAQLIAIPGRYKNATSIWSETMEHDEWWAEELHDYLFKGKFVIGDNIVVHADISIQPTAVRPLTGFEVYAGASSAIFGHPKIQLQTIPTAKRRYPRIFTTTGAVTKPNYTDSKAGKKGEAHHVFGATIVEQSENGLYHIRQINAKKDGTFIDLDKKFTHCSVQNAGRALALVCGDIHAAKSEPAVLEATFGKNHSICSVLRPKKVVYHDLLDFEARSHHYRDLQSRLRRLQGDMYDSVEEEVNRAIEFIDNVAPEEVEPVVVIGNHDEHIDRWLRETDPRTDPLNAKFFHEAWYKLLSNFEKNGSFLPAFKMFYDERGIGRAKFIDRSETLKIGNIYCNFHGDIGINGTKGSTRTYAKLGVKTVVAHCLTSEHDVLTKTGWKPISEVPKHTELLSYDPCHKQNVWRIASDKQESEYSGRLLRIRHAGSFDQEVTTGHFFVLKDGTRVSAPEAILTRSASELPLTANPVESGDLEIEERVLRKIVAVCADGSFYNKSLSFNIAKKRKQRRLEELFGDDLLAPNAPNPSNGALKRTVRMYSDSYNSVMKWVYPFSEKKCLPDKFLQLTDKCREIVLDELRYWDGTFKEKAEGGQQFSTCKESEARLVASIVTMQGYRCTMKKRTDSSGYIISWNFNREHVHVTNKNCDKERIGTWGLTTRNVTKIPTYCFTIPGNKCFWVRSQRTGLVSLTGNSHSPEIMDGCYKVGVTGSLDMGYNHLPSGWLNTHCVIYANSKRCLIHVIDGEWRGR